MMQSSTATSCSITGESSGSNSSATPVRDQWAVLGGVRFILAFVVVCHHAGYYSRPDAVVQFIANFGGFAAVIGFFAISGYSMANSLSRDPSASRFYERRFWRIYPVYLWGLALTSIPAFLTHSLLSRYGPGVDIAPTPREFLMATVFCQGFVMHEIPQNGVLWTLSLEVALYIVSPIMVKWSLRRLRAAFIVSACLYFIRNHFFGDVAWFHELYGISLFCLSWAFIAGIGYYRFGLEFCRPIPALLTAVALASDSSGGEVYSGLTTALVLMAVWHAREIQMSVKMSRFLMWLGNISYCLYICHLPVMYLAQGCLYSSAWGIITGGILLAIATFYVIDFPIRCYVRWRTKFTKVATAAA